MLAAEPGNAYAPYGYPLAVNIDHLTNNQCGSECATWHTYTAFNHESHAADNNGSTTLWKLFSTGCANFTTSAGTDIGSIRITIP
jgi:hypothetical protein